VNRTLLLGKFVEFHVDVGGRVSVRIPVVLSLVSSLYCDLARIVRSSVSKEDDLVDLILLV
jgi:hypothetical protein